MARPEFHVRHEQNKWTVRLEGEPHHHGHYATHRQAVAAAIGYAKVAGADVVIHEHNGVTTRLHKHWQ